MAASYTELPAFYDFLGEHPDYEKMAERIINVCEEKGAKESGLVLDLACGTGKLACALLDKLT